MPSETIRLSPPKLAVILLSIIAILIGQPVALLFACILDQNLNVAADTYVRCLILVIPIMTTIGIWIGKYHVIQISKEDVLIRSTRYGWPTEKNMPIREISELIYKAGLFGFDNRPRPFLDFISHSGISFWTSLALYRKKDIEKLLFELRNRGVQIKTNA